MSPLFKILLAVFFTVLPLKSFATEISYPPFFAIDQTTSIGNIVRIFFSGALGIGAIVAAVYVVVLGFRLLQSRGNAERVSETRKRIINILAGVALLLGAIVILRTINPEIANLHIEKINFGATPQPINPPAFTQQTQQFQLFDSYPLGQDLNETDIFLNNTPGDETLQQKIDTKIVNPTNEKTIDLIRQRAQDVKNGLAACSYSLCSYPGPIDYKTEHVDAYASYCGDPQTCTLATCNSGDPCSPGRNDANTQLGDPTNPALGTTVALFQDMQTFWQRVIQPERTAVRNCVTNGSGGTLINYVDARLVAKKDSTQECNIKVINGREQSDCTEATDFFCESPGTSAVKVTRIHLSLDELIKKEQAFIDNIYTIENDFNKCSCQNTTADCSDSQYGACDTHTVKCTANVNENASNGCFADTWSNVRKLISIGFYTQGIQQKTLDDIGSINTAAQTAIETIPADSAPNFYIDGCAETKTFVGTWEGSQCPTQGSYCCPGQETRSAVAHCTNEDFFACFLGPAKPPPGK